MESSSEQNSELTLTCKDRKHRGKLIVFEGIDGSGKSTQCDLYCAFLRGLGNTVEKLVFPDRTTTTGRLIHAYLNHELVWDAYSAQLFFAQNRHEKMDEIKQKLKEGITLVVDRYSGSGIAYGVAKGMPQHMCIALEQPMPKPDITYLLHLPVEAAVTRLQSRGKTTELMEKNQTFQRRVGEVYQRLAQKFEWIVIDTTGLSIQSTHDKIVRTLIW